MTVKRTSVNEALAIWNALLPKVRSEIESRTNSCVKRKRATVTVAPHQDANGNFVMTVQEPYGTAFDVPYNPALENQAVGTSVWLEWSYSASNMVAVAEGNGTFPASGGGGGGGDMLKSVYDPNNYNQDIFSYADSAATSAAAAVAPYWCTYGTTTSAQIETAYAADRAVLMVYSDRLYSLVHRGSSTSHDFVCVYNGTIYTASCSNGTWSNSSATIPSIAATTSMLKGDNAGNAVAATAGTDYQTPLVAGTDYQTPLVAGTDYQTPLAEKQTVWYGTCSTSGSTAAKTATITGITALATGLTVLIKFTNGNTVSNPTLDLNTLGAKAIAMVGSTSMNAYGWKAGETLLLVYDGTNWISINEGVASTSYYGVTKLSSSTSSTSTSVAATPSAVKTAYDLANGKQDPLTAGTDYIAPPASPTNGDVLTYDNGSWIASAPSGGGGTIATTTSMLKGDNDGNAIAATAGTDYQAPLTAGTDYIAPPASPNSGDVLTYNGSSWGAAAPSGGSLPSQTGHSGEYLTTDGTDASWSSLPTEVFWVTYGTTTNAEIYAAIQAGKLCVMDRGVSGVYYLSSGSSSVFQTFVRTLFMGNGIMRIVIVTCNNDIWSIDSYYASIPNNDTITTTTTWTGSDPYTQTVTLANYTPGSYTKVDIQPDAATIAQLISDGVKALYVENNAGTLTMYAIGAAPSVALTLQVTCEETRDA